MARKSAKAATETSSTKAPITPLGITARKQLTKGLSLTPKTQKQADFITLLDMEDVDLVFGVGAAGTGKAQPLTSKVLTPQGWTTMGELKVGDMVIGGDGKPTKVVGVYPQGKLETFSVKMSDGSSTECCGDHLWFTEEKNKKSSVKTLKDIKQSLRVGYDGRHNHKIPMTLPVEFNDKPLFIDPYIMGVILGDGGISQKSVVITSADLEIIDYIDNLLPSNLNIVKIESSKYSYAIRGYKDKNILINYLDEIGLLGTKSDTKFIPEDYLINSVENRIELLRGLMDSDGTVRDNGTSSYESFSSVSNQLVDDIAFIVQSLGGKASITKKQSYFTYKGEKKAGKPSYVVHISLPPEINPFKLKRKKDKVVPRTKYIPSRFISEIVSLGEKDCQCIMVDNKDHLYITDDFIVTHNTLCALMYGLMNLDNFDKIIYIRPNITCKTEDSLGALPGDLAEKLYWIRLPIYDQLSGVMNESNINRMFDGGLIEISNVSQLRGRSLQSAYIIIDECFTGETEILTENGFVRFDCLSETDKVAQYNGQTAEFVIPERIVKKHYEGALITHSRDRFSMTATSGHQAVYEDSHGNLIKKDFSDKAPSNYKIPVSVKNRISKDASPLTILTCALQADGSYLSTKTSADNFTNYWTASFKKEEKIKRFEEALISSNTSYSKYEKDVRGRVRFYIPNPDTSLFSDLKTKTFSLKAILDAGLESEIVEECLKWDGSLKNDTKVYCSTNKENIEVIQACSHLTGYSANFGTQFDKRDIFKNTPKPYYRLCISDSNMLSSQKLNQTSEEYNGEVYCVTVPSGMIFVRQNNKVFISGNCQNLTADMLKTVLTRIGQGSKMVLIGDTRQSDLKKGISALHDYSTRLSILKEVGLVEFNKEDVVRNVLITKILDIIDPD
jgi:phosphate starvation-inducible protein PhoH